MICVNIKAINRSMCCFLEDKSMNNTFKKSMKKKNQGVTLIELIVVIAIMTVLAGMLVPQFAKYITDKRKQACRANREAIMNVYEKCVYGLDLPASQAGFEELINSARGTSSNPLNIPEEYLNEVRDYLECPIHGTYTFSYSTSTNVAKIDCDGDHESTVVENAVVADFTGWTGSGAEAKADPAFATPTPTTGPAPTDPPDPSPSVTPSVPPHESGVWPHLLNEDGSWDSRWETAKDDSGNVVGPIPGAHVDIPVPAKAHFIEDRTGAEYVIVKPYGGTGVYRVKQEWARGPEFIDESGWEYLVLVQNKYDTETSMPPSYHIAGDNTTDYYYVSYGDTVTIHFGDKKVTYIYASLGGTDAGNIQLPTEQNPVYGTSYNNWYLVPDLCTGS